MVGVDVALTDFAADLGVAAAVTFSGPVSPGAPADRRGLRCRRCSQIFL